MIVLSRHQPVRITALRRKLALLSAALFIIAAPAAVFAKRPAKTVPVVSEKSVRKHMYALAGDSMRGRGSATPDELAAAKYIAAQLKLMRIKPAGDDGGYLQTVKFMRRARGNPTAQPVEAVTTNVIGIIRGRDRRLRNETILLSAHLDHLGTREGMTGDNI